MEFILTNDPCHDDVEEIRQGLRQYNAPHIRDIADQTMACFSCAPDGTKQGGIIGRAWGNWLVIQYLWVSPNQQQQGIGSGLLKKLEQHASSLGCQHALVDTLDFQARPFYERHGYQCQMTLENYPEQGQLHFMTKSLE
ncbi:GNAT family N-acetyltransferase [Photobacterium sp. TY1-4]|uniref:GNAT family N-acetyltransferase n=1 Tax=Photobacterium sp. TY1-4 TaxID=2899122 RepID=UPI0021C17CFF|nr:GNAT family N-acetyltransferase [Photobacterium sp. TY1-4]UXI02600.1 GNAT family N-acetyltransferase [Photobacterium sp. TY1-4]